MTKLFILGMPGSGKGTVSRLLLDKLGSDITYYNVGSILREQASSDNHIKTIHAAGGLVNSDRVLNIFDDALSQQNYLVDGSPRKENEAEYILSHQAWKDNPGTLVHLSLDSSIAKDRLLSRSRFDDKPEIIENRMKAYFEDTIRSVEKFKQASALIEVDATKTPEQVADDILKAISQ